MRLHDGSPLAVPEWMTRADAGLLAIRDTPRLPRETLSELRAVIDGFLRFDAIDGGTDDATNRKDVANQFDSVFPGSIGLLSWSPRFARPPVESLPFFPHWPVRSVVTMVPIQRPQFTFPLPRILE